MKLVYIIFQLIMGFFMADLLAGFLHWFEDTYLDYCINLPIIGEFAKDNEMHHYFPRSILAYSYLENIYFTMPITIMLILILYLVNKSIFYKYIYFIGSFGFFAATSNLIHRFTHMRDCETNDLMKFFQRYGIFCSHEHHKTHHELIDQKYCVITEYNNYILDNVHFWRGLEHIIYFITGIKPNRKKAPNEYEIQTSLHKNAKLKCPDTPTKEDVEYLKKMLSQNMNC